MAVNLKALTPSELQALIDSAQAQMSDARKNLVQDVRVKIDTILKESGLTLDDVYHRRGSKSAKISKGNALKGSTVPPKYRNPENPSETWTGRGRQPAWVVAALKKRGATIDMLLINKSKAVTKRASKRVTTKTMAKRTVRKKVRKQ